VSPWVRGQSANPGGQSHAERRVREMESLVIPTTFDGVQPTDLEASPLTASFVADFLGVSRFRVHQLDGELKPERGACGCRIYDPAAVLAYARKRELEREALARARSERMRELRRRMRQ
jgi:hypothetical protein